MVARVRIAAALLACAVVAFALLRESATTAIEGRDDVQEEESATIFPPPWGPGERALVRENLDQAKKAKRPGEARRLRMLAAGRILDHASRTEDPDAPLDKEVTSILREACKDLGAEDLTIVAKEGSHPELSAAFCRALERRAPRGVPASLEIAAEARDALYRFGAARAKDLAKLAARPTVPTRAAGGTQHSVYEIMVALTESETFPFVHGLTAGLNEAWPDTARWFSVRHTYVKDGEAWSAAGIARALAERPGVLVLADGPGLYAAASSQTRAAGIPLIDACGPMEMDHDAWSADFARTVSLTSGRDSSWFTPPLPWDARLHRVASPRRDARPGEDILRTFVMRPSGTERARRLGEALRAGGTAGDVAIAVPTSGGDRALARGFEMVAAALGRRAHVLYYPPGRRDFAPEVRRFVETRAGVLLLAGPGEESAEWVGALARAGQRPLILGSGELHPAGFHADAHKHLEGAIFSGDDWSNADVAAAGRPAAEFEADPARERGRRAGRWIANAVKRGAFTPASLTLALREASIPVPDSDPWAPWSIARLEDGHELTVPLFVVKNGEAVPLTGF